MRSCLNCVWAGFVIEKDDGLYGYEGDCNFFNGSQAPSSKIWDYVEDDLEELETSLAPIFQKTATDCKYYEQTGVGHPI